MPEHVTLKELAGEFGLDRSACRKYVVKHGFETVRIRTKESRAQLTLAVTLQDAEAIRELRKHQGFISDGSSRPTDNGVGYFYVIQVVPEFSPNRVKLGFAADVDARLAAHRTSAPSARLVKSWPCHRNWEQTAIASVTRTGCEMIANEVYECDDVEQLVKRGDKFFSLMPS